MPVGPGEVERVVDPAPADVGGCETFSRVIAARCIDIVHHQIERCRGAGLKRLVRLSYDNMRAAAELENGEVAVGEDRAQADGLEPPRRTGNIGCRKPHVTDRYRRPLIESL
jgi:hypothetical protein